MVLQFRYAHEALEFIISKYNIESIHIPYYLCDVVRHTLFKEGCKPLFYHIDDNFMPLKEFREEDYVLYPNYFGICDKNADELAKMHPKLILDNAHAYYSKPQGFACFNSAYKFNLGNFANLWIENNFEKISFDKKLMQRRKNKFLELHKIYGKTNIINIDMSSIPFCYPYLAETEEKADTLVKSLTDQGLTIYRYWNSLPKNYNEYKFYSRLVPIPICL